MDMNGLKMKKGFIAIMAIIIDKSRLFFQGTKNKDNPHIDNAIERLTRAYENQIIQIEPKNRIARSWLIGNLFMVDKTNIKPKPHMTNRKDK